MLITLIDINKQQTCTSKACERGARKFCREKMIMRGTKKKKLR